MGMERELLLDLVLLDLRVGCLDGLLGETVLLLEVVGIVRGRHVFGALTEKGVWRVCGGER